MDYLKYQNHLVDDIQKDFLNKLDEYFINGLKLKGFEFESKHELEVFIKQRCRCMDNLETKVKTYLVDDIPFFIYNYNAPIDFDIIHTDREIKLTAQHGSFAYV